MSMIAERNLNKLKVELEPLGFYCRLLDSRSMIVYTAPGFYSRTICKIYYKVSNCTFNIEIHADFKDTPYLSDFAKTESGIYCFITVSAIVGFIRGVYDSDARNTVKAIKDGLEYAKNDVKATEEIMKKENKTPCFKVNSIEYTRGDCNPYGMPRHEVTINAEILPGAYFKNGPRVALINAIQSIGTAPCSDIKDVIFNNPATIVLWADGTKTVVKAENEKFDPEKGLAMAIAKKALGNNYDYYDIFKKYVGRYEKKQKKGGK